MYAKVDSEISDSFLKCEKWMKLGRHKWKERKVGWGHLTEENPAGGEIDDEEKWPRKQGLFQVGHCSRSAFMWIQSGFNDLFEIEHCNPVPFSTPLMAR